MHLLTESNIDDNFTLKVARGDKKEQAKMYE